MVTQAATQGARAAAVAVHVYTATGVVLALLMVHFSYEGDVKAVLWLFLAAMVVDGTDGLLARRLHVKTVVPTFDGALLDNIVDYITYAFAPMVLLWANGYLPDGAAGGVVAAIPLLASCYQFCRTDAKTEDHFFLGFPSYWNVVAFYAIVCSFSTTVTTLVLLVFAVLVFVPVKYLYPSRTEKLWYANMALSTLWLGLFAVITAQMPDPPAALVVLSLGYVVYYVAVSLWLTFASPTQRAQRAASPL
jgi:phosphatidylcholine synthase